MVMKPDPIFAAVEDLKSKFENRSASGGSKILLMSPAGRKFDQKMATEFSSESHLIIICGHYEGVDHRVIEHLVDAEISIGDYVLTNGAIAAAGLVGRVVGVLPGGFGDGQTAPGDRFWRGTLA